MHLRTCPSVPSFFIDKHLPVTSGGEKVEVFREQGMFTCRCLNSAGDRCAKMFKTISSLKKHRTDKGGKGWQVQCALVACLLVFELTFLDFPAAAIFS